MADQDVKTLRGMLSDAQRKLDILMALDEIRDTSREPSSMFGAIVNLIAEQFEVDLCLLVLLDRDTGELELKAVNDRSKHFGTLSPDSIRGLARRAMKADSVDIWEGTGVTDALGIENDHSMQMAVVPIVISNNVRLGALMLTRRGKPFSADDIALLRICESQVDSAVIQGYDYYELQLRNRELETVYRVDRIRDQNLPFDDMLNAVLEVLRSVINAEMGFIMLYNHTDDSLELRAVSHDDLFRVSTFYDAIGKTANRALSSARLVYDEGLDGQLTSIMCIPLILRDEILGVFGVANGGGKSFEERERRLLIAIASQMDTAIFENLAQRRLKRVLGRSVDPRIMERLLANPDVDFLKGERQEITVLYSDLRGSTSLAEDTDPELLVGFVNSYLGAMADVILKNEGTLDKFVGDEVMALFNAPYPQTNHALKSVQVALSMVVAHEAVMDEWREKGINPAPIGIGIATGDLTVGEMGSAQRTDYTVIGKAANLGARICGAALPGQVLISEETYQQVKDLVDAEPITGLNLKGVSQGVVVYHVKGLK